MINEALQSPEFLDQLLAGDREAFGKLVEITSPRIYGLSLRMMGNEQDAEDVLQETYLKAFKALPQFEQRSSVTTWLFRIAANEALMLLRKRKKLGPMVDFEPENSEEDEPLEIVDWCCLPENELLSSETRLVLEGAATKLSVALKSVFLLRDVQGFSVRETAEILDLSEDVVKTRLVRARLKLRDEISTYFRERATTGVENGRA